MSPAPLHEYEYLSIMDSYFWFLKIQDFIPAFCLYNVDTLYIPPHCKQFQTVHLSNKNQCFATALVTSKLRLPLHVHVKLIVAYICLYSFVLAIRVNAKKLCRL